MRDDKTPPAEQAETADELPTESRWAGYGYDEPPEWDVAGGL